jgi:hypothetical protein
VRPACGEAARSFIAALAGTWTVESSVRVSPDRYAAGTGDVTSTVALGGCGLVTTQELEVEGVSRSEVRALSAGVGGRIELSAADSEHGGFTVSSGRLRGDTLFLEWSRDLDGRTMRTRKEYRLLSRDVYDVEHRLSRSHDDPWVVTYRGTLRRVARAGRGTTPPTGTGRQSEARSSTQR